MELADAIRSRRMCRDFSEQPVPTHIVDQLLELARRAPSGGYTQGYDFLVLEGRHQTERLWQHTLPSAERDTFRWPGLLRAPVLVIPMADPAAYLRRYSLPDKRRSGLGDGPDRWPVPYWYIDAAMATENLLLAAVDAGLGALFFGIFRNEAAVLEDLGVPDGHRPIGVVALGHPSDQGRQARAEGSVARRPRRPLTGADGMVHRNGW